MKFEVQILGSNSALPAHGRHPSSQLINHNEQLFLVDCGEGTQMQMSLYKIRRSKINVIFISHLHGDHIFGLPGLITSYILNGRKSKLTVIGPIGLKRFLEVTLDLDHHIPPFELIIKEIDATLNAKVYENQYLEVYSLPLNHRIPTAGYKFSEKIKERHVDITKVEKLNISFEDMNRLKQGFNINTPDGDTIINDQVTLDPDPSYSFAYCSDTAYMPELVSMIKGVDCLYHEATFMEIHKDQASKRYHSTTKEAAQIAKDAHAKKLLIGHFSSRYTDLEPMVAECKSIFENSFLAEEGKIFNINYNE